VTIRLSDSGRWGRRISIKLALPVLDFKIDNNIHIYFKPSEKLVWTILVLSVSFHL
jgi:hypothetical protein